MPAPIDLAGKRFGQLTCLGIAEGYVTRRWLCRCDCGATEAVHTSLLTKGRRTACVACRGGRAPSPEGLTPRTTENER